MQVQVLSLPMEGLSIDLALKISWTDLLIGLEDEKSGKIARSSAMFLSSLLRPPDVSSGGFAKYCAIRMSRLLKGRSPPPFLWVIISVFVFLPNDLSSS
jgi:hypothetical protein